MSTISNRSEILFLYEIENTNPNGDPFNENRPRFDLEDSRVLVSDVRLKRTIRDYWFEYNGFNGSDEKDIYARETRYKENGKIYVRSGKERAELFKESKEKVLETCIDVRVFGGILPIKGNTFTYIGPVQFQMGKSLNKTNIEVEEGTSPFASSEGDKKKGRPSLRTEYKIPYALIGFNGIINEKAAQYTQMTEDDRKLLIEGIWNGTKNLISRSKFGQTPLLLLVINYREPFYIGGLRQRLKLNSTKSDLQIRSLEDYELDISEVKAALKENADKIENISIHVDSRLKVADNDTLVNLKNGLVNEL